MNSSRRCICVRYELFGSSTSHVRWIVYQYERPSNALQLTNDNRRQFIKSLWIPEFSVVSTLYVLEWETQIISHELVRTIPKYRVRTRAGTRRLLELGLGPGLGPGLEPGLACEQAPGEPERSERASPVPAPIALLSEFFCFALAEIFFRPRREPVRRLSQDSNQDSNQDSSQDSNEDSSKDLRQVSGHFNHMVVT